MTQLVAEWASIQDLFKEKLFKQKGGHLGWWDASRRIIQRNASHRDDLSMKNLKLIDISPWKIMHAYVPINSFECSWKLWRRDVTCRASGPGFNPSPFEMFFLSFGNYYELERNCQSKTVWCQRTQMQTLAVLSNGNKVGSCFVNSALCRF